MDNNDILEEFKRMYKVDLYGKSYFGCTDDKNSVVDVVRWGPFEHSLRQALQKAEQKGYEKGVREVLDFINQRWDDGFDHTDILSDIALEFEQLQSNNET